MTIKGEGGYDIPLVLLKTPIPLACLEYEERPKKFHIKSPNVAKKPHENSRNTLKGDKNIQYNKLVNITLLKQPISLDSMELDRNDTSVTFNVKTVQGTYVRASGEPRKRANAVEDEKLRQNVMTLLEYTTVYPFVYVNNKFLCYVCSECFLDSNLLKHHTNGHNLSEFERKLGNKASDTALKVDVNTLQCKICPMTLNNLQSLKEHLKNDHDKNIAPEFNDNVIPFKLGGKTHECQICSESFKKLRLLIIHMNQHFNNYSCEVCGAMFITRPMLKRHLQIHNRSNFPCDRCSKVFNTSSKRSSHIRGVHLKLTPRRCPICSEKFKSNYQRTKHLRIVHNETSGQFKCETCGRDFDLSYTLAVHIRSVHLQEKNHECPVCRTGFFSKNCLNRHMVIHTGEKNFKCHICGKAYARKKNLMEHIKTHELGPAVSSIYGEVTDDHASLDE